MKTKQIPKGWKEVELKEVAESISAGGTPRRDKKEYWENGTIPWVKISDMKNKHISKTEEKVTEKGLKNSSANLFPKGTLLYSIFASLGTIGILEINATTNQAIAGIIPKKEIISTKYLYYCLQTERDKILSKKSHATQDNLNLTILRNHKIPLPPLPIQKQIVSILEKAEELKQKRKDADKLTKEYLQSVFYEMFLSNDFEMKKIEEITINVTDGKHGDCKNLSNSGYYFISAKDIFDGCVHYENARQITKENYLEVNKRVKLELDDVLITNSGTIGKTAIMDNQEKVNKTTFQKSVAVIKPNKRYVIPVFLKLFLDIMGDNLINQSSGSSQKNLLLKDIRSFEIPLPPMDLQNKFASIVEEMERLKEKQRQSKEEINQMFDSLMQKAFKGGLV